MYFSRSIIVSALVGLGAATTHAGEGLSMNATGAAGLSASETLAASAIAPVASATGAAAAGGMVATHVIQVGGPNGSLTFSPENVKANVGDLVQFQFHPKNHSVVQSTFGEPCVPIQNVTPNVTSAFFSGFMPTNASAAAGNILTYTIRVTDAKPVWFYCSQAKHCQGGMVGAINAAASGNRTMSAFKALAAKAAANISPGQASGGSGSASPSGGAGGAGGAGGSASSSGAGGGAGAAPTSTAASSPAEQTGNSAPGLYHAPSQSLFGLAAGVFAAFFML